MRGFFSKKAPVQTAEEQQAAFFGERKTSPAPPPARVPSPQTSAPSGAGSSASRINGGYGSSGVNKNEDPRGQLFGGAGQRQQQQQQQQQQQKYHAPPTQGGYGRKDEYSGQHGGYGHQGVQGQQGGYGQQSNTDRNLTEAEEEEEDVEAVKQQIRFTKQESVASSRNALRVAAQAEETGRNTLARLGAQGERLYNTEKNLDLASSHSRVADQKARELKVANGSMFAIHMKNPLRSASRAKQEEARILARHQEEREERERTREFGFESKNGVGRALNGNGGYSKPSSKMSLAERSKYQFEADESDDEKEREIENNLDALGAVTGRLRNLAMATGQEVDRQNVQIDVIMRKSDKVDDQIAITHGRIRKIH
ncbi:hypothetical protein P167DRAFT_480023 [Morchella conica CCBAS932]|uniref:t-SNARE coiled-coil homology domain-containing protein n=1 Tax=Morchella conica CCBAS932 TaxID=1392247 RepID=A0A3N4L5P4_9PEZI|nr:hypothetical protein P167DRAFT_480023 [Morchella conica CCBAS932]